MAKKLFYNRHSLIWMRKFTDTIPEKSYLHKATAFCLAAAIHHQITLKKSSTIKLTHDILKEFCVNRKHIKQYLDCFQKAGLIHYSVIRGSSPFIELLEKDGRY